MYCLIILTLVILVIIVVNMSSTADGFVADAYVSAPNTTGVYPSNIVDQRFRDLIAEYPLQIQYSAVPFRYTATAPWETH